MRNFKKLIVLAFTLALCTCCFMASTMTASAQAGEYVQQTTYNCLLCSCKCDTQPAAYGDCSQCGHAAYLHQSTTELVFVPDPSGREYVKNPFTGEKYYPRNGDTFRLDSGRGDPIWDAGLYEYGPCDICTCSYYLAGDGWCRNCSHSSEAHIHPRSTTVTHTHSYGAYTYGEY